MENLAEQIFGQQRITIDDMFLDNSFTMEIHEKLAMGYLYKLQEAGLLKDHPFLEKTVKEHRVAYDENATLLFGPNYLN